MSYDFDLVCIGSGPAGQRAAVQAAKLGKRVAVSSGGGSSAGCASTRGRSPARPSARRSSAPPGRSSPPWPGRLGFGPAGDDGAARRRGSAT